MCPNLYRNAVDPRNGPCGPGKPSVDPEVPVSVCESKQWGEPSGYGSVCISLGGLLMPWRLDTYKCKYHHVTSGAEWAAYLSLASI